MSSLSFDLQLKQAQKSVMSTPMWCNWKGESCNWAGPLPSLETVASGKVHASPTLLRFCNPSFFISGFIHHNRSMWSRILHDSLVRSTLLRFLEFGVDATEFFVKFEGSFQGQVYSGSSPPPPLRFSPTVKAVEPFLNLSLKLFWSEWPMDLCRFGGRWGKCHLLTWLSHHLASYY